ncbi:hypothetical protein [Schlesneria paludicola]|uniref:hypothetical protein n=1 Tax=Schlesneria paludicola TaxID=360056 RepID=UPI000299E0EF|nr:hypothetical protein [Schlesneria paludicola]
MPDDITPRRIRVPREDRSLLAIPELTAAPRLIAENRALFAGSSCALNGRTLVELRDEARREALDAARSYTSSLLQTEIPASCVTSLVVGGHQPELFHVGVWAKNFALAGFAHNCHSAAINLVIDNDTMNGSSVRVPVGSRDQLRIERVLFDTPRPTQPWEEVHVRDVEQFRKFGPTLRQQVQSAWHFEPLAGSAWDAAVRQLEVSSRLCDAFTALRAHVERAWGLRNLELPMSQVCEMRSFHWFFAHLIARLPELHAIYNQTVADYRRAHRIRSRTQPVPNLDVDGDWLEAPFWVWRRGDLQRGRLFARRKGDQLELRDEQTVFAKLPLTEDGALDAAVGVLNGLKAQGIRIRTRALTTTLFARVCLADIFVHGIGGGKYDEMTDRICERFFGLQAPRFMTVSATLYLPLGGPFDTNESQLRDVQHRIRDLHYNPDRHLESSPTTSALMAEKTQLLNSARTLRESHLLHGKLTREQHRRLQEIRTDLGRETARILADYQRKRDDLQTQITANTLIKNREFSFVLYPEGVLRQFLQPFAEKIPQ